MSFRNLLNCDVKEGKILFYILNLVFTLYIYSRIKTSALEGLLTLHSDIQFEFKIYEITIFFIANFVVTIFSKRIILNFIKNLFIGSGIVLIGLVFL